MAAGTIFPTRHVTQTLYARMSAIRCRTDTSGFIVDTEPAAHPYDPPATVSGYSRPTTESGKWTPNPSQLVPSCHRSRPQDFL